jgi:DNA-binding phage protein
MSGSTIMKESRIMAHFRSYKIPERAHPLVKQIYREMQSRQITIEAVVNATGVSRGCFKSWRDKANPQLGSLEAIATYLGFDITLTKMKERNDA